MWDSPDPSTRVLGPYKKILTPDPRLVNKAIAEVNTLSIERNYPTGLEYALWVLHGLQAIPYEDEGD